LKYLDCFDADALNFDAFPDLCCFFLPTGVQTSGEGAGTGVQTSGAGGVTGVTGVQTGTSETDEHEGPTPTGDAGSESPWLPVITWNQLNIRNRIFTRGRLRIILSIKESKLEGCPFSASFLSPRM